MVVFLCSKVWLKAYYHQVRALIALERYVDAMVAFSTGLEMGGSNNESFRSLEEQVSRHYIRVHYDVLTRDMGVDVRWIDSTKGKGLFARRAIRMFQPIFTETPLVSHRKLEEKKQTIEDDKKAKKKEAKKNKNKNNNSNKPKKDPLHHLDCCSFCMRAFITENEVKSTRLAKAWPRVYGDGLLPSAPPYVWCERCQTRSEEVQERDPNRVKDPFLVGNPFFLEKYCSAQCREQAERQYHMCMCGAAFVSDEKRVHPLHHLYNLCVESGRSNPLMIARIFATVFQRVVSGSMTPQQAYQDFRNFVGSEEPTPIDEMAVFLLKNLFANFPFMEDLVTVPHYRRLNSVIIRNAQTVTPVSDLHMWFEKALQKESSDVNASSALLAEMGFKPGSDELKDYMAAPEMLKLSRVEGTALLAVANCMNHSCDPNVLATSSHNDHRCTFVALRPIEEGEELCISYVDDNLDWKQRQEQLKNFYHFDCKCIRCHVQKENIKILE